MKAIINSIVETIIFILGGKGDIRKEAQEDGICYYGGQGDGKDNKH